MGYQILNDSYPFVYLSEYDYIILACDLYGDMKGLYSKVITHRYPDIIGKIRERYGDSNRLGTFDIIENDKYKAKVVLLYCITTPSTSDRKKVSIKHLKTALNELNIMFKDDDKKFISNILGTQLSEGKNSEEDILKVVEDTCKNIDLVLCRFNNIAYYNIINDLKILLKTFKCRRNNTNLYYYMNSEYILYKVLTHLDLPHE